MFKAFILSLLLVAPVVLCQRGGGPRGPHNPQNPWNPQIPHNPQNPWNPQNPQGRTVPQNWVDNRAPSCANIETLIAFSDSSLDTVNARISGIKNVLPQLLGDLATLRNYCQVRNPTSSTRNNIQAIIRGVDTQAQPLVDDSTQRAQFSLDQYNSQWRHKSIPEVCQDVYGTLNNLISYFQWLSPALKSYYIDNFLPNRLTNLYVYENQCICRGSANLCIIGATWGTGDVTNLVQRLVNGQGLVLRAAENPLPRDNKPNGYTRSLVVVYQQGNNKPKVAIAKEGDTLIINPNDRNQTPWVGPVNGALNIFGAAWGLADVTASVAGKVSRNQLTLNPSTATFGDSWANVQKTLTVVYQNSRGAVRTADYVEVYDASTVQIRN